MVGSVVLRRATSWPLIRSIGSCGLNRAHPLKYGLKVTLRLMALSAMSRAREPAGTTAS